MAMIVSSASVSGAATMWRTGSPAAGSSRGGEQSRAASNDAKGAGGQVELTPDQQRQVAELQKIDRKVRAHEAAHLAAAGGLATSGASYSYTYGPDGKRYVTGGEVGIDTSAESKPRANIDKGQRIQRAALAPADPSPQDRQVASAGAQLEARGRSELMTERRTEHSDTGGNNGDRRQHVARTYGGDATTPTIDLYA
jgi:hypothetical protein